MAKEYTITKEEGIKRICEAIREAYAISDAIDDKHLATNSTFSSVKIDSLLSDIDTRVDKLESGSGSGSGGNIVSANSSYTIENSVDYPLMDLNMYGKSIQQRYNGKNLFDFNAWKDSISSVTNGTAVYGENSVKLTASSNDCFALGTTYYIAVKPKTTYTLSWVADNTKNGTNVVYVYGMNVDVVTADNTTTKSITFTTKPDSKDMRVQFGVQNAGESITYSNIQLEVGETATSYEPYVGGVPAPNPNYPQEIKSVGDGGTVNITSNNGADISVTASITSALPLCGIPVSEGGNYVDSTGQQWICDELVYNADGTGKIIKRINKTVFNGSEAWALIGGGKYAYFKPLSDLKGKPVSGTTKPFLLSNKYTAINGDNFFSAKMCMTFDSAGSFIINDERFINNIDELKADMSADNLIVVYALATPYEIQLTSTEMSALRQLQTFNGTTNISNDAGAEMSVKYCTSKVLSEYVLPITKGLQAQIDELKSAVLSLGGNV